MTDIFTNLINKHGNHYTIYMFIKSSFIYLKLTHATCRSYLKSEVKVTQSCHSLWPHGLYSPWNLADHNTGVGSCFLLQGIFPTQGSNPGLPYWMQIIYHLSHQGSPTILEWVAYPFSWGTSPPRKWASVSCIAGRFFTSWATREAQQYWSG